MTAVRESKSNSSSVCFRITTIGKTVHALPTKLRDYELLCVKQQRIFGVVQSVGTLEIYKQVQIDFWMHI